MLEQGQGFPGVLEWLERLKAEGVVADDAITDAVAASIWGEATATQDLGVAVMLAPGAHSFDPVRPILDWLAKEGYASRTRGDVEGGGRGGRTPPRRTCGKIRPVTPENARWDAKRRWHDEQRQQTPADKIRLIMRLQQREVFSGSRSCRCRPTHARPGALAHTGLKQRVA